MGNTSTYCAAIADVARMGHDDIAEQLLTNAGFSLDHIIEAGTDEYDLEEIRKLFSTNVWTQEEIDEINKEADELHKSLPLPNVRDAEVEK